MEVLNLRRCAWEEMLTADMRANHFAELVGHYLRLEKALRVAALLAASGTVGTALSDASDLHGGWNAIKAGIRTAFGTTWTRAKKWYEVPQ
jgi:hypothetical protein